MRKILANLLLGLMALGALAVPAAAHPWPVWPDSSHHQIMQLYGQWLGVDDNYPPGMHNGTDIVIPAETPVYAIQSGYVKAVLTIASENTPPYIAAAYWRILIGDSAGTQPCDAWMYAHVSEYSIAVHVGDWVNAGDSLAIVVNWYNDEFPSHLHLSKVNYHGDSTHWTDWNSWAFVGNPLDEVEPVDDIVFPILENAYGNQLLAFCANETSNYFDEGEPLSGDVDIICRASDNYNWPDWQNIPYMVEFSIGGDSSIPWTNSARFSQAIGCYDDYAALANIIFKNDNVCDTYYDPAGWQSFHFVLTNTDGDSISELSDKDYAWQTANFHNGPYLVRTRVCDRAWNYDLDSMTVNIANYFNLTGHVGLGDGNPYKAGTIITVVPDGKNTATDTAGNFSIPLVGGGLQTITFTRPGYETIDTVVVMNQAHDIDIILAQGAFVCGDANSDNVVNIRDVTYLISFLYRSGTPPLSYRAADANGDGVVNIKDITLLINFLYKSGPTPQC